jgi:hypothetical protein
MINLILLKCGVAGGANIEKAQHLPLCQQAGESTARQSITLGNYNSLYLLTGVSFVIQREDFEDSRAGGRNCRRRLGLRRERASFPNAAAQLALFTNGLSKYNSGKSQNSRKELLAWVEIQISASGAAARARLCTQMAL